MSIESYIYSWITCEKILLNESEYDKKLPPSNEVNIYVTVLGFLLLSIDEKNQLMISKCNITQLWYDQRLSWDPELFSNTTKIPVPLESVWKPNTIIRNTASSGSDGFLPLNKEYNYAIIYYDGSVTMSIHLTSFQTRCILNIEKYPFDQQKCSIT